MQLGADEQHPRAAVLQDVDDLVAHHPPIDDRRHRADRGCGEENFKAGGVVLVQERHGLAALHTGQPQRSGRPTDPRRPVAPGPLLVPVADRYIAGPLLRVPFDEPGERFRCAGVLHGSPIVKPVVNGLDQG